MGKNEEQFEEWFGQNVDWIHSAELGNFFDGSWGGGGGVSDWGQGDVGLGIRVIR